MKLTLCAATIAAALFIAMVTYTTPLRPSIPELQLTFTEPAFKAIVAAWPPGGVERFRMHFAIDFPFLISYGVLGYLLTVRTRLFALLSEKAKCLLACCLPSAAAFDIVENLLHLYLVSDAVQLSRALYLMAGIAATIKWLLIVVFVCSAAYALCEIVHRHRGRGNS